MPKPQTDRVHCPECGSTRFAIPAATAGDEGVVQCDQCGAVLGDWRVLKQPKALPAERRKVKH